MQCGCPLHAERILSVPRSWIVYCLLHVTELWFLLVSVDSGVHSQVARLLSGSAVPLCLDVCEKSLDISHLLWAILLPQGRSIKINLAFARVLCASRRACLTEAQICNRHYVESRLVDNLLDVAAILLLVIGKRYMQVLKWVVYALSDLRFIGGLLPLHYGTNILTIIQMMQAIIHLIAHVLH